MARGHLVMGRDGLLLAVALLMVALAGGNGQAWQGAAADGSLWLTLVAIGGCALLLLAAPGLLALLATDRQARR